MAGIVEVTLEAFEHVEHLCEARLCRRLRGKRRAIAAAAEQQHDRVLARLRLELAHEARIAREARAGGPGHMQAVGHVTDERALLGGAHVDEPRVAGRDERPRVARRYAARVRQARGKRGFARRVEHGMRGTCFEFDRHDVSLSISRIGRETWARLDGECRL
ncbi:thiosulfate sulfurtransferase domain protein [Burkholderia pseudomallei]|nr:thiosulfate sulfurtransferase domain protein [Burkholderia pseudomallei]